MLLQQEGDVGQGICGDDGEGFCGSCECVGKELYGVVLIEWDCWFWEYGIIQGVVFVDLCVGGEFLFEWFIGFGCYRYVGYIGDCECDLCIVGGVFQVIIVVDGGDIMEIDGVVFGCELDGEDVVVVRIVVEKDGNVYGVFLQMLLCKCLYCLVGMLSWY